MSKLPANKWCHKKEAKDNAKLEEQRLAVDPAAEECRLTAQVKEKQRSSAEPATEKREIDFG